MSLLSCEIVTLFPELFDSFLQASLLGKAIARGQIEVHRTNPRDFVVPGRPGGLRPVDDAPYGGGPGMILRPEPVVAAVEYALARRGPAHRILLSPQGLRFDQRKAVELADRGRLLLICGRYEGIDHRVELLAADEVISIGDYVLAGGEVAAAVVLEAVSRLVPGVLGSPDSLLAESHQARPSAPPGAQPAAPSEVFAASAGATLLEYPQWTRPPEFRGLRVPEVLLSGDHGRIAAWRLQQARELTARRRPDLLMRPAELPAATGAPDPAPDGSPGDP